MSRVEAEGSGSEGDGPGRRWPMVAAATAD